MFSYICDNSFFSVMCYVRRPSRIPAMRVIRQRSISGEGGGFRSTKLLFRETIWVKIFFRGMTGVVFYLQRAISFIWVKIGTLLLFSQKDTPPRLSTGRCRTGYKDFLCVRFLEWNIPISTLRVSLELFLILTILITKVSQISLVQLESVT